MFSKCQWLMICQNLLVKVDRILFLNTLTQSMIVWINVLYYDISTSLQRLLTK